jgi:uncharacterized Zn-finger protein
VNAASIPRDWPPLKLGAPLTCPSCRHRFKAHWIEGRETVDQACPSCGHVFKASWPGLPFRDETVIIDSSGEVPGRGAA